MRLVVRTDRQGSGMEGSWNVGRGAGVKTEIFASLSASPSGQLKGPHFLPGSLGGSLEGNGQWTRRQKIAQQGRQRERMDGGGRALSFFCWAHA